MTSRVRRIVLAMYGHKRSEGQWMGGLYVPDSPIHDNMRYHDLLRLCYEAMDEPDEPLVVIRGNFGLPCA